MDSGLQRFKFKCTKAEARSRPSSLALLRAADFISRSRERLQSVQDITKAIGKKMHNNENNVISSIKIGWAYSRDQRFVFEIRLLLYCTLYVTAATSDIDIWIYGVTVTRIQVLTAFTVFKSNIQPR